jgi:hypothetical protein
VTGAYVRCTSTSHSKSARYTFRPSRIPSRHFVGAFSVTIESSVAPVSAGSVPRVEPGRRRRTPAVHRDRVDGRVQVRLGRQAVGVGPHRHPRHLAPVALEAQLRPLGPQRNDRVRRPQLHPGRRLGRLVVVDRGPDAPGEGGRVEREVLGLQGAQECAHTRESSRRRRGTCPPATGSRPRCDTPRVTCGANGMTGGTWSGLDDARPGRRSEPATRTPPPPRSAAPSRQRDYRVARPSAPPAGPGSSATWRPTCSATNWSAAQSVTFDLYDGSAWATPSATPCPSGSCTSFAVVRSISGGDSSGVTVSGGATATRTRCSWAARLPTQTAYPSAQAGRRRGPRGAGRHQFRRADRQGPEQRGRARHRRSSPSPGRSPSACPPIGLAGHSASPTRNRPRVFAVAGVAVSTEGQWQATDRRRQRRLRRARPSSGERIPYIKLDHGAAGSSSPATVLNPSPVGTGHPAHPGHADHRHGNAYASGDLINDVATITRRRSAPAGCANWCR